MRHVACMGVKRNVYKVLVGKHKGKRQLGRTRHRGEDNVKYNGRMWTEFFLGQ